MDPIRTKYNDGETEVWVDTSMMNGGGSSLQIDAHDSFKYACAWLTPKETKKLIKALKATLKTD